jgi:Zn-dependent peptidase ImmA (M78 family)/transcriptional regulator with XRE-family HTH domain
MMDVGKKIRQLREARGMSQEKLEKRLKLPQKALSRIESGERLPSTVELGQLSELFHVPVGEFFKETVDDPFVALFRAAPGLAKNEAMQEAVNLYVHLCKEGIFLEKLLELPPRQELTFSSSKAPTTSLEAIKQGERAAKEERRRLGMGNMPIGNIEELINLQGVWCGATRLPSEISGLFLYHASMGRVVLINGLHTFVRKRFSYAHEYAHALFDTHQVVHISITTNAAELVEKRANAFAAAFLMPEDGIAEILTFLNKGAPSRTPFAIFDVSTEQVIEAEERQVAKVQKLSAQDVAIVAHRFGVSYQAAVYRLHSLQYLSLQNREELLSQENRGKEYLHMLGLENVEQVDKGIASQRELRAYIAHLVIEAFRQEKISHGRLIELSKLLNLPAQKLFDLAHD